MIPALYRRTADELLVELHLLSHQKHFKTDLLFAVGLQQVFETFTRGYRPEEQLPMLFDAICTCNGFDPVSLRAQAEQALQSVKGGGRNLEDVQSWIQNKGEGAPEALAEGLKRVDNANFHYSRLMAVGVLTLLVTAMGEESTDPEKMVEKAHQISEAMGFSKPRVQKDLSLYTNNLEKMTQAVALIEETLAAERRKREREQSVTNDDSAPEEIAQGDSGFAKVN